MLNTKYVFFLGSSGFPYGLAEVQKIILISKALVLKGNHVTILCRKGVHNSSDHADLEVQGNFQSIQYIYASGEQFRNNSLIKRNFLKIKGLFNEFLILKERCKRKQLDFAILSTESFTAIIYYILLSKFLGFKTILNYVEYYSAIKKKRFKIGKILNDKFFDMYAPLMVDAVFPISEFIIDHLKKVSPNKKYLKIPGLTEFERYLDIEKINSEKYFLFCGAASYKEVILFIIDCFENLENEQCFLYLVSNGDTQEMAELEDYISRTQKKDNIKLFTRLSQIQLFTYYKNAVALLIPLRPTWQDIARFPHKFGEYLASGNPVITTNYGEVTYYFEDLKNMFIANNYEVNQFVEKMQFVIDNSEIAINVGAEGKKSALSMFDYRVKAEEINNFINSI